MTHPGKPPLDGTSRGAPPADAGSDPAWLARLPVLALLAVAVLLALDVLADARAGSPAGHLVVEVAVVLAALAGAAALWRQLAVARRRARVLQGDLRAAVESLARFRAEALDHVRGLAAAIHAQLERWGLSPAEHEIALLLLKGLSLKEIAQARATSERTVRQQALAIYRKAGLSGRAELAAFFLEDLLVAPGPGARTP